ncbi:uncharacterized protein LOC127360060 [Dicentrarchus labrax]|uniref:uncharacterized protein LOC127360060 n=1 Tax=Dicentrarchus labrax TaxID=13489 RepID=UPI0021F653C9|nr:uncharacterized protein LOC127360060 [Dicentrarchus labrax]
MTFCLDTLSQAFFALPTLPSPIGPNSTWAAPQLWANRHFNVTPEPPPTCRSALSLLRLRRLLFFAESCFPGNSHTLIATRSNGDRSRNTEQDHHRRCPQRTLTAPADGCWPGDNITFPQNNNKPKQDLQPRSSSEISTCSVADLGSEVEADGQYNILVPAPPVHQNREGALAGSVAAPYIARESVKNQGIKMMRKQGHKVNMTDPHSNSDFPSQSLIQRSGARAEPGDPPVRGAGPAAASDPVCHRPPDSNKLRGWHPGQQLDGHLPPSVPGNLRKFCNSDSWPKKLTRPSQMHP